MARFWTEDILDRLERDNPWYRRAAASRDTRQPQQGLNVCGYLRDESGWGAAGRGYVRALQASQIPFTLCDLSALSSNRSEDLSLGASAAEYSQAVNLLCVDPGQHFAARAHLGEEFFEGRFNIGAWAWELPRFPHKWYDRLAYYDELWVTTSFVANAVAALSPVPVVRIPPVLTPATYGVRERGRNRLGIGAETFLFLFVFDFHSHMARKNPLAVVEAFKAAFRPDEPAHLVIKCVNGGDDRAGLAALCAAAAEYPVSICDGYWPVTDVRDLMASADAYVSLHRSEGTGITITDAMAHGVPVIATGWSGNMDFMTVANSYPVRYELVKLQETVGPYAAGEEWAEPSIADAASSMRQVFTDREDARARGRVAKHDIETRYSEEAIAEQIRSRLEVISHRHRIGAFRQEMRSFFTRYQGLSAQIRPIVDAVVPPAATVVVVSKGDDALLDLDGRQAWHFPRTEDGTYAGYYPATSAMAIEHLELLRARGGSYLLFPGTALWWLDHYTDFRAHLEREHRCIWADARCVIYQLAGIDTEPSNSVTGGVVNATKNRSAGAGRSTAR